MSPIEPKEAGEIGKQPAQEMLGLTLHPDSRTFPENLSSRQGCLGRERISAVPMGIKEKGRRV